MGYLIGLLKYMIQSAYKNTHPTVKFGSGTFAILLFYFNLGAGQPVEAVFTYLTTKHLPPYTVEAFITVLAVGCVWAGIKWYSNVPRR